MPLKTIVKVSHVSNLSDARYCAGMGVEMLGFGAIPGQDYYLAPGVYQDIRGWISGPKIIAELYGLSDPAQLQAVIQAYAPDYLELTHAEYLTFNEILRLPCIVHVLAGDLAAIPKDEKIVYLLTDEDIPCEDIEEAGWPVLKKISSHQALEKTLKDGCYKGVVLEGPKELRPGITNYDQLGTLLETLEAY